MAHPATVPYSTRLEIRPALRLGAGPYFTTTWRSAK